MGSPRRARGRLVALEGAPGSGKTTVGARVAARLGGVFLPEAWRRLRPRPSLAFRSPAALLRLETRLVAAEGRRYRSARALARRGHLVLADTGFFGPLAYTEGLVAEGLAPAAVLPPLRRTVAVAVARGGWVAPDITVYLATDAATRRRRVVGDPAGHPPALAHRHEAVGEWERRLYIDRLAPLLGPRFRSVSGRGSPGAVARRVAAAALAAPTADPLPASVLVRAIADAAPGPPTPVRTRPRRPGPDPRSPVPVAGRPRHR
jgi:thymidylate kinase